MDVNSKDGKLSDDKVTQLIDRSKIVGNTDSGGSTIESEATSNYMACLFKTDPSRYWYIEARKAEMNLEYMDAANKYTAAYTYARNHRFSSAPRFKWEAMRCIEFHLIYQDILKEWDKVNRKGKVDANGVRVGHWYDEKGIIPCELFKEYKDNLPLGFHYNIVTWDDKTKTARFIHCPDFYQVSEPAMEREYEVGPDGFKVARLYKKDPEVLFDKWMLVETDKFTFDRKTAIRRSIKIRYLNIPENLKSRMHLRSVWQEYVVPAIGNRSLGKLYEKFLSNYKEV